MRRLNGRFAKEPRRGVDPNEQRQIEEFIARKGVTKLPDGHGDFYAAYAALRGSHYGSSAFSGECGRHAPPRGHSS